MLARLELRDFAIIDVLGIDFGPGLNVLTGETGAGKSIVVDGLSLLVGERPDASMIRSGGEAALVQGVFEHARLASAGRRLVRDGRNTARVDGELVTVAELVQACGAEVAIFGQHSSQQLLDSAAQRVQLDRLLGDVGRAAYDRYRTAYVEHRDAETRLCELEDAKRERARQLDMLQFQRDEIDAAGLEADEDERLEQEARGLHNAERIVASVARTVDLLSSGDLNAADLLARAERELQGASRYHDQAATLAAELEDVTAGARAIAAELEAFLDEFESDPHRLEVVEARIGLVERLKRKYGASVEDVLAYRVQIGRELAGLEADEEDLEALRARMHVLEASLAAAAADLGAARRKAAAALTDGVAALLPRLAMPDARFAVEFEDSASYGPHGAEAVRFSFSANRGEPLRPLASVASGGELSRLMLAIHVVGGTDVPTVVFDEVDAGIGGRTARAVGELLRQLARDRQVLLVTHLPQVAAFAHAHFAVAKEEHAGRTVARVRRLEADDREAELARMLSGAVTDASLRNARELLSTAETVP